MEGQVCENDLDIYKSIKFIKKSILSKPISSELFEKGEKKMVKTTAENRGRRES